MLLSASSSVGVSVAAKGGDDDDMIVGLHAMIDSLEFCFAQPLGCLESLHSHHLKAPTLLRTCEGSCLSYLRREL